MKIFLACCFFMMAWGSVYAEPSLRFMENPIISEDREILLGDVALLENLQDEDKKFLEKIKIADSHEALVRMSARDIARKIRPQIRVLERNCECKIHITLPRANSSAAVPFSLEAVRITVKSELKKGCSICETEVADFHLISGAVPATYKKWEVNLRKHEWRGHSMVRVFFDDDAFSPLVLQTLIKIKQPVLKLKKTLGAGASIEAGDYEMFMVDVTYENKRFAQPSDLISLETKRTLPMGWALSLDELTGKNMIRLGQPVAVEVQNNSFVIEMAGVAQKTGKLGEKIPVRLNKTKKEISAEIISDARVRM